MKKPDRFDKKATKIFKFFLWSDVDWSITRDVAGALRAEFRQGQRQMRVRASNAARSHGYRAVDALEIEKA